MVTEAWNELAYIMHGYETLVIAMFMFIDKDCVEGSVICHLKLQYMMECVLWIGLGGSTISGAGSVPKKNMRFRVGTGSERFKEKHKD